MKSFKQYIHESTKISALADRYNDKSKIQLISGLINPSRDQLQGFLNRTKHRAARFILHKDRVLVWDANGAIHDDVIQTEHPGSSYDDIEANKNSAIGTFYKMNDDSFKVGISNKNQTPWVDDLLQNHPKTRHLVSGGVPIEHID